MKGMKVYESWMLIAYNKGIFLYYYFVNKGRQLRQMTQNMLNYVFLNKPIIYKYVYIDYRSKNINGLK